MGRPRTHHEAQLYHVTARGNNRRRVFEDDKDRSFFLTTLAEVMRAREWLGYSYCLMDNHVHLVLGTTNLDLADGMRDLLSNHARRYNVRHGRTGHLFSERFRTVAIEDDRQLLTTLRYVAANPVRAGLVRAPEEWEWSSYADLVTGAPQGGCFPPSLVLPLFHPIESRAIELLRRFVAVDEPARRPSVPTLVQLFGTRRAVLAANQAGWTHQEIAIALGIGRTAVTKRLQRASPASGPRPEEPTSERSAAADNAGSALRPGHSTVET